MKSLVKLGLSSKTVDQKILFGRNVVSAMTVNVATFASPSPALSSLTLSINSLETAVVNAANGGKTLTSIKNDKELAFDITITALGKYVDGVAQGDETIVLKSGMDVKRSPSPIGPLPQPINFSAKNGEIEGDVKLKWKRVHGAAAYIVYFKADSATDYQLAGESTKAKFLVSGLTPGLKYWFKTAGIGAAGQGPFSDPASQMAI